MPSVTHGFVLELLLGSLCSCLFFLGGPLHPLLPPARLFLSVSHLTKHADNRGGACRGAWAAKQANQKQKGSLIIFPLVFLLINLILIPFSCEATPACEVENNSEAEIGLLPWEKSSPLKHLFRDWSAFRNATKGSCVVQRKPFTRSQISSTAGQTWDMRTMRTS